jgi:basic membrane protein A and related proteins
MNLRRYLSFLLVALLLLTASGCGSKHPALNAGEGKYKVALILVGPISDAGWNASAYQGMKELSQEQDFHFAYAEAVPFVESQAAMRDYASRGYDLIVANNFGFSDYMVKVAKDFPETNFAVITGRVKGPNLSSYDAGQREGTFMAGALAALMSKTGTIGIVGGVDDPSIIKAVEGFKSGARHAKPGIKVMSAYTGSYSDIAKAKETALSLIGAGADAVSHVANQSGLGVIQAAKEKGVWAMGTGTDQHAIAPKTILTTAMTDMKVLEKMILADARSGKFGNQIVMPGIKEGVAYLAPFYDLDAAVPAEVKQQLAALAEDIKSGKVVVPEVGQKTD